MASEVVQTGIGGRVLRGLLASGVVSRGGSLPYSAGWPVLLAAWVAQLAGSGGRPGKRPGGGPRQQKLIQSGAWRTGGPDDLETLQAAFSVRLGI